MMEESEFASAEAQAKAAVVRWQWFDGPALDPRPFLAQRTGGKPGKPLEDEPKLKIGAWHWGFDREGRPLIGYQHLMKKITTTVVYEQRADGARVTEFDHNPEQRGIWAVSEVHGPLDHPREITRRERDALIRETYTYDGQRLTLAESVRECPPGKPVLRRTYTPQYGAGDEVTLKEELVIMDQPVQKPPPLKKSEIEPFARALEDRLIKALMQTLRKVTVGGPVYCLILAYDCDLPPMPALGTDEQRQRWRREHGDGVKDYLWNPAEFEHYETPALQLEDDALLADCQRLATAWRSAEAKVRKFVNGLARRLADAPWPAKLKRTDDFVIIAVDLEGADLERNMREVIPPAQIKWLRDDGWL